MDYLYRFEMFGIVLLFIVLLLGGFYLLMYVAFLLWKYRDREERSLDYVLLQMAVPRENEIKIDAAEQLFASLYGIHKSGFWSFLKPQPHLSFEIVAKQEDIRFYAAVPRKLMDLVEKQIHGAYPGADIKEVDEYSIFSETGQVAFAALRLKNFAYMPIRIFRDLPTDPLSSLTSVLAKMGEGEGAVVQVLIQPAESKWRSLGRSYISKVKKDEANPEKASFKVDSKSLEAIEQKTSKPGFNTVVRIVVSSTSQENAKMHLDNLLASFGQFTSDNNNFTKVKFPLFTKKLIHDGFYLPILSGISICRFFSSSVFSTAKSWQRCIIFPIKQLKLPTYFGSMRNGRRLLPRFQRPAFIWVSHGIGV